MKVWRSVGAVMAGFLAVVMLSIGTDLIMHTAGIFPAFGQSMGGGLFVLATVYRMIYTIAGGYLTARLAPERPMRHTMVLASLGFLAGLAGAVATWNEGPEFGPKWYPIALVVTAVPCTWLGGRLLESKAASRVRV